MPSAIHIKLEYPEAVNLKKQTLLLEKNLLETIKSSRNYSQLRKREFLLKAEVNKNLSKVWTLLESLNSLLPRLDAPDLNQISKTAFSQKGAYSKPQKTLARENNLENKDIENQLREIHEKLARLN